MRRGLVAAIVTGLCLVGAGPAWAVFPGENGRIAFGDREGGIHTILPSGHGDRVISSMGFAASWSPTGRRIVFGDTGNIYTMRADGTDVRQLTFDGQNQSPSYSPSGGRIVFQSPAGITTMKADGSNRQVIAPGVCCVRTWAPNGEIAYWKPRGGSRPHTLLAMRPDGTHRHLLALLGSAHAGYGPFYSPDGDEFLFVRRPDQYSHVTRLADADGSNVREPPCQRFFARLTPTTYSPDGRWVLGARQLGDPLSPWGYALARVNLASCEWKKVVSPAVRPDADWQPIDP